LAKAFSSDIFSSNGFVVVSNDFEHAMGVIKESFAGSVHIFPKPFKEQKDLLTEDVEELMESAYLTGEEQRLFVIKSENYSTVVQNKLLKLLEEPPHGVKFCLFVASKAALLPTVRSRLSECEIKTKKIAQDISIDFSKLNAQVVFDTLKGCESLNKEEAKAYLYMLLDAYKRTTQKKEPHKNTQKLEIFDTAFKLLSLNTPPRVVFGAVFAKLTAK
jgi:DNA polymerase-3 subunit delta'